MDIAELKHNLGFIAKKVIDIQNAVHETSRKVHENSRKVNKCGSRGQRNEGADAASRPLTPSRRKSTDRQATAAMEMPASPARADGAERHHEPPHGEAPYLPGEVAEPMGLS